MTYIVVSENEIVKAEMERPSFSAWEIINPCVNKDRLIKPFQEHCLSLPRIVIQGKHNWKVWQGVPESEIRWQYQYCKQDNIYRWFNCEKIDHIGWPKHLRRIVAIPIQPTPEGESDAEKTVSQMAEIIQKECHSLVSAVMKESKKRITVQDATNAYMFHKLAELQLRINQLEQSQHSPTHQR